MRNNALISAVIIVASFVIVLACCAHDPKPVHADSDCPVQSVVQQGTGATVTFNCGAYLITIQEPVWK